MLMSKLERTCRVKLPFDCKNHDRGNFGIHGLDVFFIVKGPHGAVQFAVTFPAFLPSVDKSTWPSWMRDRISGFDVGYHSPKPMYDGQQQMDGDCDVIEGGKCYYDGSGLRARPASRAQLGEGGPRGRTGRAQRRPLVGAPPVRADAQPLLEQPHNRAQQSGEGLAEEPATRGPAIFELLAHEMIIGAAGPAWKRNWPSPASASPPAVQACRALSRRPYRSSRFGSTATPRPAPLRAFSRPP